MGLSVLSVCVVLTRWLLAGATPGLAYLHSMRTVHRDIKGANLLVEKNGRIKLADFGMAKQMVEHMSFTRSFKGSAFWMAPEVIRQRGHGVAADIWSVGCTVLEMATGNPPWSQCSTQVRYTVTARDCTVLMWVGQGAAGGCAASLTPLPPPPPLSPVAVTGAGDLQDCKLAGAADNTRVAVASGRRVHSFVSATRPCSPTQGLRPPQPPLCCT